MDPVVVSLPGHAPPHQATTDGSGLVSDVERKHVASIAYAVGQDRLGLQGVLGWGDWDAAPLR